MPLLPARRKRYAGGIATAPQGRRRNLAILVLLATVLSLGAAEGLVRVAALADGRIRNLAAPVARSSRTQVTASQYIESRPDALVPHGNNFGYRRNRFGFNDREPEDERGAQSFRILGPDEERRAELFFSELEGLRGDLDAAGVPMALVMAPTLLQVESEDLLPALARALLDATQIDLDRPAERILSWAAARNVPVLDLTPFFKARAGDPPGLYIPNDTHWNIAGNGLAGLEVGRWLVQSGLPSPRNPDSDD